MSSKYIYIGLWFILTIAVIAPIFIFPTKVHAYSAGCDFDTRFSQTYIDDVATSLNYDMLLKGLRNIPPTRDKCTAADKAELIKKVQDAHKAYTDALGGPEGAARDAAIAKTQGVHTAPPGCSSLASYLINWTCWGRSISVYLGTALIAVTAWLLAVAGMLFNLLVDHTIITFGSGIYALIKDGVEIAWTALRDIANILIIGMFTFIAISIIIGLKEYGQKKLIARVLIIAVLINFSLLFTKMIIDASNFTATQFYNAAGLTAAAGQTTGVEFTEFSQAGISGQFISLMGVPSISATKNALSKAAFGDPTNDYANADGWLALLHGLSGATMLLAAALVLLYGSYLLVTRMLIIIFLMISASVAFASHLIPRWSDSSYGWSTWWSALLRSAVLAPFLMIFLWISLTVGNAVRVKANGGSLGDLLVKPDRGANLEALFVYIVVLGLLFISFKLSSYWASRISGFNVTGSVLSSIAGAPFTLGSQFLMGPLGRSLLGRYGAQRSLALGDKVDKLKERARDTGNWKPVYNAMRSKMRADKLAGSSFNLMNTETAKALTKTLGITPSGADKKAPSFADSAKAKAEKAAKEAAGLALSADDKAKIRNEAYDEKTETERRHREDLKLRKEAYVQERDMQKTALKTQMDTLAHQKEREEGVKGLIEKEANRELKTIEKEIKAAAVGSSERADAESRHAARSAKKDADITEQDSKIEHIDNEIKTVRAPIAAAEEEIEKLTKAIDNLHDGAIHKIASDHSQQVVREEEKKNQAMAATVGAHLAGGFTSTLMRFVGLDPAKDTVAGKLAFKQTKNKIRVKAQVAQHAQIKEDAAAAGETLGEETPSTPEAPAGS